MFFLLKISFSSYALSLIKNEPVRAVKDKVWGKSSGLTADKLRLLKQSSMAKYVAAVFVKDLYAVYGDALAQASHLFPY